MKLQLVIQETTAGLNNQFVSENIDINNDSIKSSLKDERMLAAQIANQSVVYSVQILDRYKVYSAIYTDIADFTGRSGYYSIKIYTQRDTIIRNLISLHKEIKNAYLHFKATNQINSQNYDSILSNATLQGQGIIVCPKAEKTCFLQYNNLQEVESTLNNLKVYSIDKLYLFDAEKALKTETILGQGLINFNTLADNLDAFEVDNSTMILRSLFIGEKQFSASNFPETFRAFRKRNDAISYLTTDNSEKQNGVLQSGILIIKKKVVPVFTPPPTKPKSPYNEYKKPQKSIFEKFQIPIISIMILFLGCIGYFVIRDNKKETDLLTKNPSGLDKNSESENVPKNKIVCEFESFDNKNPGYQKDYEFFVSKYNEYTSLRYFVKQKNGDTCKIITIKPGYTSGSSPINLLENEITDVLMIKRKDSLELFISKIEGECGCKITKNDKEIPPKKRRKTENSGNSGNSGNSSNTKESGSRETKQTNDFELEL
jgi:hypothetical protein